MNEGLGADVGEGHKCQEPGLVESGLEYTHPAGKEAAAVTPTSNNEAADGYVLPEWIRELYLGDVMIQDMVCVPWMRRPGACDRGLI